MRNSLQFRPAACVLAFSLGIAASACADAVGSAGEMAIGRAPGNASLPENRAITIGGQKKESLPAARADITVSGKVTDENGAPLPGVNIKIKGTATGSVADATGSYTLTAGENETLVFSYIGYKNQEVGIDNRSVIDVKMAPDVQSLGEIVIVGFGTQKKHNVTGAATTASMAKVLGDRPVNNSARALQGAVPGLEITYGSGRPGTGTGIKIRGFESINGGEPLILMDNAPVGLGDINPRDIESVTVLKDASATSIYGARASFGVVLITTKKAARGQGAKLRYGNTFGVSEPTEIPKPAAPGDFVRALNDWGNENFWTGQNLPAWLDYMGQYEENPEKFPLGYAQDDGIKYPLAEHNVLGEFLGDPGFLQIHNLSLSGTSSKTSYRLSLGYSDEDGVLVTNKDRFTRYNLNAYIKTEVSDKLDVSLSTNYVASTRLDPKSEYYKSVTYKSFTPTGNHTLDDGTVLPYDTPTNIVRLKAPDKRQKNNLRLTGKLDFKPVEGLTVTSEYTYENRDANNRYSNSNPKMFSATRLTPLSTKATTFYRRTNGNSNYFALNLYSKYEKSIGNHNTSVLIGLNRENKNYEYFSLQKNDLISTSLPSISLGQGDATGDDTFTEWAILGYFGRINYNYKEKYFLELNGRYDGSSRFPTDNRFGFFPSVSAGWQLMSEPFMRPMEDIVSGFKLRASWGEIGNQNILKKDKTANVYPFLPSLDAYQSQWLNPNANQRYISLRPPLVVSKSFTWERVQTLNFGLDAGFIDNKLTVNYDRFVRKTLDMLARGAVQLPALLGTGGPLQNVADLETNGWELQVAWRDKISDFKYSLGFNLYDNQTKITKFNNEEGALGDDYKSYYEGKETDEIWGYTTDGYYTVDDFVGGTLNDNLTGGTLKEGIPAFRGVSPNPGDIKYKDVNGDGEVFSGTGTLGDPGDLQIIGNATSRYQFGIFGNVEYKGFDLSFRVAGVGKRDLWVDNLVYWPFQSQFYNVFDHQLDYWTPENTDAFYPRVYEDGGGNYRSSRKTQTKYLSNGAYWALQNVTLGYNFPKRITDRILVNNLRAYFSGENLFNEDHLPDGLHPALENLGSGATYPYLKKYAVGINVTF